MKHRNVEARVAAAIGLALAATAAVAEVTQQPPSGFTITQRRATEATPAQLIAAVGNVGGWWAEHHTYSHHAANLQMELQPGGCFCERWDGGVVQHARVIYVDRTTGLVRLEGALGPLQSLGVTGVLTFAVRQADGKGELAVTYRIGGADAATLEHWPAAVDGMMSETIDHLAAYLAAHH